MFPSTHSPLAPQVLAFAGVPLEDALWLTRQSSRSAGNCMRALLQTSRGETILQTVRDHFKKQHPKDDAFPLKRRA